MYPLFCNLTFKVQRMVTQRHLKDSMDYKYRHPNENIRIINTHFYMINTYMIISVANMYKGTSHSNLR